MVIAAILGIVIVVCISFTVLYISAYVASLGWHAAIKKKAE